ncbi:hypothetical protein [Piscinibacter sp.]|uniref:hypothetical protein n=1 Tax=Piscinibacter sp. TaxID=1903157 RepID=UPI0039E5B0EA
MPRRRPDSDTVDMFGFDPLGQAYTTTPEENRALLGLGVLPLAVYHVLKRFANGNGQVIAASYYRIGQVLKHRAERRGGPTPHDLTLKQLRGALDALASANLVFKPNAINEQRGVLQIWVASGVGATATRAVRAGVRAGSKRPQTRANA